VARWCARAPWIVERESLDEVSWRCVSRMVYPRSEDMAVKIHGTPATGISTSGSEMIAGATFETFHFPTIVACRAILTTKKTMIPFRTSQQEKAVVHNWCGLNDGRVTEIRVM